LVDQLRPRLPAIDLLQAHDVAVESRCGHPQRRLLDAPVEHGPAVQHVERDDAHRPDASRRLDASGPGRDAEMRMARAEMRMARAEMRMARAEMRMARAEMRM